MRAHYADESVSGREFDHVRLIHGNRHVELCCNVAQRRRQCTIDLGACILCVSRFYRLRNHLPKKPACIWLSDEVERAVFRNGLQLNLLDGVVFGYARRMIGRVGNC